MIGKRMEELTRPECLSYLQDHHLGRLAFVDKVGLLPLITPVNYLLHEDTVVFRTDPGSKLTAAILGAPVAFEVDGVDPHHKTGWSVVVRARAEEVTDDAELTRLRESSLDSWAPGAKTHYVRIRPGQISGRRISLGGFPSDWWG